MFAVSNQNDAYCILNNWCIRINVSREFILGLISYLHNFSGSALNVRVHGSGRPRGGRRLRLRRHIYIYIYTYMMMTIIIDMTATIMMIIVKIMIMIIGAAGHAAAAASASVGAADVNSENGEVLPRGGRHSTTFADPQ